MKRECRNRRVHQDWVLLCHQAWPVDPLVIGQLDNGESICSHDSKVSLEANKSDKSDTAKRKLKSGMYAKVADDVVRQLKWPHKKLATQWVPNRLQMNQLSFEQVVAGELNLIGIK